MGWVGSGSNKETIFIDNFTEFHTISIKSEASAINERVLIIT